MSSESFVTGSVALLPFLHFIPTWGLRSDHLTEKANTQAWFTNGSAEDIGNSWKSQLQQYSPILSIKAISECGGGLLFPLSLWAAPAPLPVYQLEDLLWVLTILMRILKSSRSSALRAHEPEETYPERWTKGRLCICGDTYNTLQEISGGLLGRRICFTSNTEGS